MNILSIGNSFSQDAQRYLNQIAKADGKELNCFNLYIGGCAISKHYRNMISDERAYALEVNGLNTRFQVSLKEALLSHNWDVVTLQQASRNSMDYDTYQPYLDELVEFVRYTCPKAKIAIHQTWAYEQGSSRLLDDVKYDDYRKMLQDIVQAYGQAAQDIEADYIIPSGEVFGAMLENGVQKVHRDSCHASRGLGRYALGLVWYRILTGGEIADNSFAAFDEEISPEEIAIAKKSVLEVAERYR